MRWTYTENEQKSQSYVWNNQSDSVFSHFLVERENVDQARNQYQNVGLHDKSNRNRKEKLIHKFPRLPLLAFANRRRHSTENG